MNEGVIARPGDLVTCPEGHVLYRVRNVLLRHSAIRAADFKSAHPKMPEPRADKRDNMQPCADCGAVWWRFGHDGVRFQMHFSDGWRPHGISETG